MGRSLAALLLRAFLLVLPGVGTVAEEPPTEAARVVLLLQVNGLQVTFHAPRALQDGAAQATHPLAVRRLCEAVLNSQRLWAGLATGRPDHG